MYNNFLLLLLALVPRELMRVLGLTGLRSVEESFSRSSNKVAEVTWVGWTWSQKTRLNTWREAKRVEQEYMVQE